MFTTHRLFTYLLQWLKTISLGQHVSIGRHG